MSNLSNYPSIVHLITTSTLFNWAVCAEHMASASNQAVSRSDQVNFLCNLTEYNLENLISVGNATEIGRFLKVSGRICWKYVQEMIVFIIYFLIHNI